MDNQQVTAFELGWLIGAIDGEGCVGITRRTTGKTFGLKPYIQISNCDRAFIDRYVYILKKLQVPYWISHYESKGRRRESWQVATSGLKRVITFLPTIATLLCEEKRVKAQLVLEFAESRLADWHAAPFTVRQLEIYQIVADLNVKGIEARNLRDYTRNSRSSKFPMREDIVQA
jgi:hypothetical protein